jgi:hypothetical protein
MRTIAMTGLFLSLMLVAACGGNGASQDPVDQGKPADVDPGKMPPADTDPVADKTMTYTIDVAGMS